MVETAFDWPLGGSCAIVAPGLTVDTMSTHSKVASDAFFS